MAKFDPALLPAQPDLAYEQALWDQGVLWVAGVDEAGRGPLAGPVAAAAVVLPQAPRLAISLHGVRDSKQMTGGQRQIWAEAIRTHALAWAVAYASAEEIDSLGILPATRMAVRRALDALAVQPQHVLLDYLPQPGLASPHTLLVKGDARSLSVAAASVLAKTSRDRLLCEMDAQHPGYGFAHHKGYATRAHLEALARLGPCPTHRKSFAPLKHQALAASEG